MHAAYVVLALVVGAVVLVVAIEHVDARAAAVLAEVRCCAGIFVIARGRRLQMLAQAALARVLCTRIEVVLADRSVLGRVAAASVDIAYVRRARVVVICTGKSLLRRVFAGTADADILGAKQAVIEAWRIIGGCRVAAFADEADVLRARVSIFEAALVRAERLVGTAAAIA